MKDIFIVGSGGLAREVKWLIDRINSVSPQWNFLGFIDDWGPEKGKPIMDGKTVIGTTADLNALREEKCAVVAIGTPEKIADAISRIHNPMIQFPNLVHPTSEVHPSAVMGKGNIVLYSCLITVEVKIGDFNVFNTRCNIGHDITIGSYNVFGPQTMIGGGSVIGDRNYWGSQSGMQQYKKVGSNNRIGPHSFVLWNLKNDGAYIGCPARINPLPRRE